MLGKLAYRNTKRNIKDYLIYLITVTASFSLIFAFNLVANSDEIVKLCSSMDAFKNSLFAVNILIISIENPGNALFIGVSGVFLCSVVRFW